MRLFLDDIRFPRQVIWVALPLGPWEIVRSYDEFVAHIKEHGVPAFVTFDHDLSVDHYLPEVDPSTYIEKTGRDCATWLVEYCLDTNNPIPEYQVHSMNPVGAENIRSVMESGRRVQLSL
jgi:hypothetical protein